MKTILWLVIGMLVSGFAFGENTNAWNICEKYERSSDGWVKCGPIPKGGLFGIDKTAGDMRSPSALRVRMKNANGALETKKIFNVPVSEQGKELVVEAILGYNFKADLGDATESFSVKAFNKRGESVFSKEVSREKTGGNLQGTSTDMEINRFVMSSEDTKDIKTIQVSIKAKVYVWSSDVASLKNGKTCMSELWIRSLTIKEQE